MSETNNSIPQGLVADAFHQSAYPFLTPKAVSVVRNMAKTSSTDTAEDVRARIAATKHEGLRNCTEPSQAEINETRAEMNNPHMLFGHANKDAKLFYPSLTRK